MATAHRTAGAKSIMSCWLDQGTMSPTVPVSITSCCFGHRSPSGFCSILRALLLLSLAFSSASVASGASLLVPFLTACTCCTCLSKWSRLLNSFLHFSHAYIFVDSPTIPRSTRKDVATRRATSHATGRAPDVARYCRPVSRVTVAWVPDPQARDDRLPLGMAQSPCTTRCPPALSPVSVCRRVQLWGLWRRPFCIFITTSLTFSIMMYGSSSQKIVNFGLLPNCLVGLNNHTQLFPHSTLSYEPTVILFPSDVRDSFSAAHAPAHGLRAIGSLA